MPCPEQEKIIVRVVKCAEQKIFLNNKLHRPSLQKRENNYQKPPEGRSSMLSSL